MEINMVGMFNRNQYGGNVSWKSIWWEWFVCNNIFYGNPHGGYVLPVMIVGPTKFPSGYSGTVTFKMFVKYYAHHPLLILQNFLKSQNKIDREARNHGSKH